MRVLTRPAFMSATASCHSVNVPAAWGAAMVSSGGDGLKITPPGCPTLPTRWFKENIATRLKSPFVCAPADPPPMARDGPFSANSPAISLILSDDTPTLPETASGEKLGQRSRVSACQRVGGR